MLPWIYDTLIVIDTLLLFINLIILLIILAILDRQGLNPKKKGGGGSLILRNWYREPFGSWKSFPPKKL